ncbi:MAG: RNA polymerase sigma factor [Acidimicrobiia bacterium]
MEGNRPLSEDRELFAELYPALRRFAYLIARQDGDDLVQEALARTLAVRSLSTIEEPLAYLRKAMLHIHSNHKRARSRGIRGRVRIGPGETSTRDQYPSDLADLMRVSARARAVLFLTVVEGLSYFDAADVVGCSESAARQLASRAVRSLRRDLEEELPMGELS